MLLFSSERIYASTPSFEQPYYEAGYKSLKQSLTECEQHFQREIKLPKVEPAVEFTHRFGRCNYVKDAQLEINNHYEVEYLNQNKPENHLMIWVYPLNNELKRFPRARDTIQTYTLNNGNEARFGTTPVKKLFNVLSFEKNDWYYIISSDRRSEIITGDVLVQLANSI